MGGSLGFTVFKKVGTLVYESGANFEHALIEIGHYPDKRLNARGVEPEGMEFASFDGTPFMGVYDMSVPSNPVLKQLLPEELSPEGAITLLKRNLFATANEVDLVEDGGVRVHVMICEY